MALRFPPNQSHCMKIYDLCVSKQIEVNFMKTARLVDYSDVHYNAILNLAV